MSTSNTKVNVPAEMPPEAPPELIAKREPLMAELEKAAKASTGTLQQVLRKMAALISNTKPGAPIDNQLFEDVKGAFQRFSQEPPEVIAKRPPVLTEAVEWMQSYLSARGFGVPAASAAPATAAAPAAQRGGKPSDSFESGASQKARALTGDVPPPPAQPDAAKGQQEQLESFKTWMKNPGLGKVKG